jgi:sugar transferase (PEP-CTERM/EpsH1 system associated)
MRILFLSPRQCWPPDTGAKLREYHLVRQLAAKAEVTLLAFGSASMAEGLSFCHETITVAPSKRYTFGKLIRGIIGPAPVSILNYTSRAMRRALEQLLDREKFDAIQIESAVMAGYVDSILASTHSPAIVFDWHNIESELMRRYAAQAESWPKRWYANRTAGLLQAVEMAMLRANAAHIVCSEREREKLIRLAPGALVEHVANGVDVANFSDQSLAAANGGVSGQRTGVVFVGSMNYHANIEGAVHFVRNIWPRVLHEFPQSRLTLVGSSPTRPLRDLGAVQGVEVTGTVPDTRPYYAQAAIAIVPLLTGGGTRLKILEAMAAGVPVVSTGIGAEGLNLKAGEDILIADTQEEWGAAIRLIFTDGAFARRMASSGRDFVRRNYDWEIAGKALLETYGKLMANRTPG